MYSEAENSMMVRVSADCGSVHSGATLCILADLPFNSPVKHHMTHTPTIGTVGQLRATRALLKFCREHRHTTFFIQKLEECLAALETKNKDAVLEISALFKRAGMGSYLDWYPEVICEHEDPEYVETVWWALNANWHHALSAIK